MKKSELDIWYKYQKALDCSEFLEKEDMRELIRLNHLVMEVAHKIHNDNMDELCFDELMGNPIKAIDGLIIEAKKMKEVKI